MVSFKAFEQNKAPDTDLLSWTFGNQDYDQDKPIYIDVADPARTLSAIEARTMVRKLIAGLKAVGVRKGDTVCINSFCDIYYPMLYLAIIGAGGQFTGTNPSYTSYELCHHLRTSNARFIITEPKMLNKALEASEECDIPGSNIYVFDAVDHFPYDGYKSWEYLLEHGEEDWVRLEGQDVKTTVAQYLFTSGTTGLPKAAMISHSFCTTQSWLLATTVPKPFKIKRLLALPPFHAFAIPHMTSVTIRDGNQAYVMRRFQIGAFCEAVNRFNISETYMVPPMLLDILSDPVRNQALLHTLRWIQVAGAPLREITQQQIQNVLHPNAKVSSAWGMTECGWIAGFSWHEDDHTSSIGRPMTGFEVKVVDENSHQIDEDGKLGELCVKGPCLMLGYLGNPADTAAAFDKEGWIHTGDIGYQNEGKLYCVDRRKEIIKVRGWQVSPTELETVLLTHPLIHDAAVTSLPIPGTSDEAPRAYIVKRTGSTPCRDEISTEAVSEEPVLIEDLTGTMLGGPVLVQDLTEDDVKAFMREKLARYKELTGGVKFVESIPKSASGKILRRLLRDEALAEEVQGVEDDGPNVGAADQEAVSDDTSLHTIMAHVDEPLAV